MSADPKSRSPLSLGALLAATAVCAACASTPAPTAQLAASRTAITDALTAGANESAPLELQTARDKMARADAAIAAGNYDHARRLAEQAEVDARLAAAKSQTSRASLAAFELRKGISTLRENLNPNPAVPR